MRNILPFLFTPLLVQDDISLCPDSLREMKCNKGGTDSCETIGSDPGYRCNCRPGFNGPDCSNFDYELQCDQSHVIVKAKKYYFDQMGVEKDDLSLNENTEDCLATEETNENGTPFYIFKIIGSPAQCGSYVSSNNTHLKYTNAIRDAETTADASIVTRSKIEIQFHCSFPVDYHVGLSSYLKPNVRTLTYKTDEGEFVIEMRAFQDQSYQREWLPPSEGEPIEIAKGQYLPLKVSLVNVVSENANTLITDQCWGTPGPQPASNPAYQLIQMGCPTDNGIKVLANGQKRDVMFKFQMFEFSNFRQDPIHIHCVVRVCGENCAPQCDNVPLNTFRRKRSLTTPAQDVNIITSSAFMVRRKGEMESQEGKITRDGENIMLEKMRIGVNDGVLTVLIIVLVLTVGGIAIFTYMMIQKRRTAMAEEILEESQKPKQQVQNAAGTSFSIFFGN